MIYLILAVGLVLRLISLNQSFWLDEATSATAIRNFNFGQIITQFSPGDFHPPFYYLLLKIWTFPFGINEISTRLFSIFCALLTIVVVYHLGKTIKGKFTGIAAALLLATSPLFIYYSQEARMYALDTMLVALAVYLFTVLLKNPNYFLALVFFMIITLLGLTDYLLLTIIPVFWLVAILSHKTKKWWLMFVLGHAIPILAFVWWLPILIRQIAAGLAVHTSSLAWWQVLGGNSLRELLLVPVKFMIGRISFTNKILYSIVVVGAGTLFIWPLSKLVKRLKNYKLIVIWLILPILLSYLISFFIPVFSYFRLLFVLPAFYLLISLGDRRYLVLLVVLNIIFSVIYLVNPTFHREDWRGVSDFITRKSQGQKAEVLFVTDGQMEAYRYYNQNIPAFGPSGFNQADNLIWLSRYIQPIFDPTDKLRIEIEQAGYIKTGEYDFNGVVVWKYEK